MAWPKLTVSVAAIALLPCLAAAQEVHHVPKDHATIQAAVDAAVSGDTILVSGGVYEEAVVIAGKDDLVVKAKGKVVIDPPGDAAALTVSGCTGVELVKLRVTGATDGFALASCTGGTLSKCRVDGVTDAGIRLDGCDGVLVEKCKITGTGGDGIAVGAAPGAPSDDCIILLNKIVAAGEEGIDVSGDFNSVDENMVLLTGGDGIRTAVAPSSSMTAITLNKVILAGGSGLNIGGNDNEAIKNKVIHAGGHGIELGAGTGHVVGLNKVVKPGANGLFAPDTADSVSVWSCKFTKPGADGMDVQGDGAYLDGNKVSKAGDDGCVVGCDGGTWTHNRATGSHMDGFELVGAGNTLTFNKAKGSHDGFDLNDLAGNTNSVDESNKFKTSFP